MVSTNSSYDRLQNASVKRKVNMSLTSSVYIAYSSSYYRCQLNIRNKWYEKDHHILMNTGNTHLQSILDCCRVRHTGIHQPALRSPGCLYRRIVTELICCILKAITLDSYASNCRKGEFFFPYPIVVSKHWSGDLLQGLDGSYSPWRDSQACVIVSQAVIVITSALVP